jgi:hypothetical protein
MAVSSLARREKQRKWGEAERWSVWTGYGEWKAALARQLGVVCIQCIILAAPSALDLRFKWATAS